MSTRNFKVEFIGLANEQYLDALRRAGSVGRVAEMALAMRKLLEQIMVKPNEVGEPMYRLHAMKMDVRRVALAPIYLEYGVHSTEPLVIVRRVVGMAEPD